MIILKCTILKYYFLNIWLLVLLTTFNSVVFGQSSTNDYLNREATNNLNQTIQYLENLLHSLESSKIHPEQQIKKIDTYISEGQRIQTLFSDHFSALYPDKATLKDDLTQQFRHILLSLALYRSDIQTNNFKATESSQKEYDYLINRIPSVITILKMLIPVNENLVWVIHKMDELNGYLQTAYGSDAPIHFSLEGIYAKNVISIPW